ncbi:hypothetical protein PHA8399_04015 [Leisingera aquaemixtae]|uniref:Uncharacterized protein n=2 Tax=Leisingera aquaemixtae TaxID=1396826 RepID=A0A0N7M5A2_9RHOB|nr:hypothetical protein PHA8399_04015 [Leisingera aquaemixtae]
MIFEDIQDVEEWLAPLDYVTFWDAVAPYEVFDDRERDHCGALIAGGRVKQSLVLDGLKIAARLALTKKFGLTERIPEPAVAPYLKSVH